MASSLSFTLPYPDPVLSPNSSKRHWRYKQAAKELSRSNGYYLSFRQAGAFDGIEELQMKIVFFPPTAIRRDLDNAFSSMKSAIDGLCKGLGIDDAQIRRTELEWGPVTSGGQVNIELSQKKSK